MNSYVWITMRTAQRCDTFKSGTRRCRSADRIAAVRRSVPLRTVAPSPRQYCVNAPPEYTLFCSTNITKYTSEINKKVNFKTIMVKLCSLQGFLWTHSRETAILKPDSSSLSSIMSDSDTNTRCVAFTTIYMPIYACIVY